MKTALNAMYEILKNDVDHKTTGSVWMNTAPSDAEGLCIELNEADAPPHLTMGAGIALDAQIIEIGVRGNSRDYETPRDEALRVRYVLSRMSERTVLGVRLISIIPLGFVQPLGRDATNREMFTIRFSVLSEPVL